MKMNKSFMNSLIFLGNSLTKPFDRNFSEFNTSHYELSQVIPFLYTDEQEPDFLVVILDSTFFFENVADENPKHEVEDLNNAFRAYREKNKTTKIILTNVVFPFPEIILNESSSGHEVLFRLNSEIKKITCDLNDFLIADVYRNSLIYGYENIFNLKLKFLFQMPFQANGVNIISNEIKDKINMLSKARKKVIIVDADNTLWGGIIGEDGIDNIAIDENYPGIVYKYLQNFLLKIKNSGLILALVSKNNEFDVKEVFSKKNMPLSFEDFLITRINWLPKSENIKSISDELNLGLDSFVFLDDSEYEISEVRSRLKGVDCYLMNPDNPLENLDILYGLISLKTISITKEDQKKFSMYKDNFARNNEKGKFDSIDNFHKSLNMEIQFNVNNRSNIDRISQLTMKTNQFNMTSKRYSTSDISNFMEGSFVFDFSLKDRFGDMGIIGVAIVADSRLDTLLLSCRVLGRGVENKIMHILQSYLNFPKIKCDFIKTDKNSAFMSFYKDIGAKKYKDRGNIRTFLLDNKIKDVEHIKIN